MASITKRGRYWRAQVRMKGVSASLTFDTKVEAKKWARQTEYEIDQRRFVDRTKADTTTLKEALSLYEREIIAKKTYKNQELQRVRQWCKHPLGNRFLSSLRGVDFVNYRNERLSQGLAPATVRHELQVVSHFFEIARNEFDMEYLQNPLQNIRKPSASGNGRDRRFRPGEYETIKADLAVCGNAYALPAFELAIETALRQGMLFELRWEWVDLDAKSIHIPSEFRKTANKGVPARVPLSKKAIQVLCNIPKSASGKILDCTADSVSTMWKRRMKALNIQNLRWHDLRHEAASRMSEKGMDTLQIAACTGHKTLTMLQRYIHLRAENLSTMLD